MLGTPRLNPRTSFCDHVGNYKARTFDNTAWAYPIAKLLDVRLIAANGKGGIFHVGEIDALAHSSAAGVFIADALKRN